MLGIQTVRWWKVRCQWFFDEEYCDFRTRLLKKDVGGIATVVEHEGDADYKRVQDLGFGFRAEVEE